MKIKTNKRPQGNVILAVLLTAFVVGLALSTYLTMISAQNQSTLRSQSWNSSVPAMEAGVEEALTQVYYSGTTNLAANGFTLNADGYYHKSCTLGYGVSYDVGIKPPLAGAIDQVDIQCLGYAPVLPSLATTPDTRLISPYGMILGGFVPSFTPVNPTAKRKVWVVARRRTPFDDFGGIGKDGLDMNGNNLTTKSFDSSDPTQSTNGKYDPAKAGDKGNLATNSGLVNSLKVGNADVQGHVATGPNGTVAIGPQGSVGSKKWVTDGNNGIEAGYASDDANIDIPDVQVPFTSNYSAPLTGKYPPVSGPSYDFIMGSGNYRVSSLHGKVLVIGNAVLLVDSSFNFTGQDQITLNPGATLKVYVAAADAKLAGNGVVNPDGNPLAFQYYGLPSNTSLNLGGNFTFTGIAYAPEATITMGGGGSTTEDFIGAFLGKKVTLNGHINFIRDLNMKTIPIAQYVVGSWNEVKPD